MLDVKASTLQHVGQPYTVGRAGSTRNKETTKASIRKRFELADERIYFSSRIISFLIASQISLHPSLHTYARSTPPTRVEHCRFISDIVATISNLCVWYNLRQEKARDQERTVKSTCYRIGIFLFRRSEHVFVTNFKMPRVIKKYINIINV